ncbi:hypothetical protein P3T37_001744 [Kitasatospora sp. MAA4]|uniref:DUF397 domain-containing protein n=1 Tax=Kitasatospora sp. MAA4 TaxID=3035093 RepID=UPI00247700B1|nr:DUF397 domain-containing protein [Kitasatospora sp. MAA4]MDH6132359.1 hypothetical protein [Kitasatospora sp. MAA4]
MSTAVTVPGYNPPALPGLTWIKSSKSNVNHLDDSIGLALTAGGRIAIGITTDPSQAPLIASRAKLRAFIDGARAGEFDHLI